MEDGIDGNYTGEYKLVIPMRRIVLLMSVAVAVIAHDAAACGDKFLLVGRGARYQRGYVAVHPGSILLYANTPLTSSRGLRAALKMAGHKVTIASTRADLDTSLGARTFDILLADSSESGALTPDVAKSAMVVPVLSSKSPATKSSAGREFCVLKDDNRKRHPLAVLDEIMGAKLKGTPPPCEPSL
jgi:hypothetical protein